VLDVCGGSHVWGESGCEEEVSVVTRSIVLSAARGGVSAVPVPNNSS
jgi:hypothetical protein